MKCYRIKKIIIHLFEIEKCMKMYINVQIYLYTSYWIYYNIYTIILNTLTNVNYPFSCT